MSEPEITRGKSMREESSSRSAAGNWSWRIALLRIFLQYTVCCHCSDMKCSGQHSGPYWSHVGIMPQRDKKC